MNSTIIKAISDRRLLQIRYDGFHRTVEPHAYGRTSKGHEVIRVWQVSGGSSTDKTGWKLLRLDEASGIAALPDSFSGPRPGFKRGDKAMDAIFAEL